MSYDYEVRVSGVTYPSSSVNTFTYNGLDTRVGKVYSAGTAMFKRDGADVTDPVLSDGTALYTPGVSEHRGSATSFDHADYLGSLTRQTNSSQATTGTRAYDAFGMLVSSTGTPQGPFGFAGAYGYQEDPDSGLKLLGHRYYDPSTGRFLTRDPAKDGRNWYGYCENDPPGLVDPDGDDDGPYNLQVPKLTYGPPMFQYPLPPESDFPPLGYPKPTNPPSGPGISINPGAGPGSPPAEVPIGGPPKKTSGPSATVTVPGPTSGFPIVGTLHSVKWPGGAIASLPGGGSVAITPNGGGSLNWPIPIHGGPKVTITLKGGPHTPTGATFGLKIPFD